ncbi:MAG: thiol:disulfide interchange protein DsbA/DsbL [Pseudoxanthomonas sp.]
MSPRLISLSLLLLLSACGANDAPPATAPVASAAPTTVAGEHLRPRPLAAQNSAPMAGTDYFELPQGAPYAPLDGQVEVVEVFGYTCGHCARFEPLLVAWKTTLPPGVRFTPVPAALGGYWVTFAQAFYAAEQLGIREKSHEAMFAALHVQHSLGPDSSPEQIARFYAQFGVDPNTFVETMHSSAVDAQVNQSRQFAVRSRIEGTPSLIIDGKYLVPVDARGYEHMLGTAAYLVAQQHAALK